LVDVSILGEDKKREDASLLLRLNIGEEEEGQVHDHENETEKDTEQCLPEDRTDQKRPLLIGGIHCQDEIRHQKQHKTEDQG
jgi:hypothetical protein